MTAIPWPQRQGYLQLLFDKFPDGLFKKAIECRRVFQHNEMTDTGHKHYFKGGGVLSGSFKIETVIVRTNAAYRNGYVF